MNVVVLGGFEDGQTGLYLLESFSDVASNVNGIDVRRMISEIGYDKSQKEIFNEFDDLKNKPNLIVVMKGLEFTYNTLKKIKEKYPDADLVNWFFDVHLGPKPIWQSSEFFDSLRLYDYFFCNFKGVADELNDHGFKNAINLKEGCSLTHHAPVYMNNFQLKKYGEDVAFVGTVGFHIQHPNRIPTLSKIIKEGFNIKIWGGIVGKETKIPIDIRRNRTDIIVTNEQHSKIAQSSLINIGIDGNPEYGWGARLYRIMCAGGLYLTNYANGLEKYFNINKKDEEITENQDLVVYYDLDDLIKTIDFLLENDDIRTKIAENGMNKVQKEHTFKQRVKKMIEIIKNKKVK